MKIKFINNKVYICIMLVVGLIIGVFGVGQVIANDFYNKDKQVIEVTPSFPMNENGQTYGSSLYCTSPETIPDLIQAMGIDGTEGYVLKNDLNGEEPKTPEEALAMQNAFPAEGRIIPLYAADGKKVIGEFRICNGKTKTISAEDKNQ